MIKTNAKTSGCITLEGTYLSFINGAKNSYNDRPMTIGFDDDTKFPTKEEVVMQVKDFICQEKLTEGKDAAHAQFMLYFDKPAELAR